MNERISKLHMNKWITLNVGGIRFTTTLMTLTTKEPNSMLAKMFEHDNITETMSWANNMDAKGAYLIDRSPKYFEAILNFLRTGVLIFDKPSDLCGLMEEARYFGLESLMSNIETAHKKEDQKQSAPNIFSRNDVVNILMSTTSTSALRFQGINFSGADLSFLDLSNINFKYANLSSANLTSTNLSHASLERCNLTDCILNEATLQGIKMSCANLENASLINCDFNDPTGTAANLEGANFKGANLEGSQMAYANLRVANLKNANLRECNLRSACLAGANLENCDLTKCDLQEANLRGANLQHASFTLMLNPLHSTQILF